MEQATRSAIALCGPILRVQDQEVGLIHQLAREYLLRKERDSNVVLESFRLEAGNAYLELV